MSSTKKGKRSSQFANEFQRNLLSKVPSIKILRWQEEGILKTNLPELNQCVGVQQDPKFHQDDVFKHCLKTCDNVPANIELRWAALLHDVGKAVSQDSHIICKLSLPEKKVINYCNLKKRKCGPSCPHAILRITFYRHEIASEKMAKRVMNRFKVKEKHAKPIIYLVGSHMYNFAREWTHKAFKKFVEHTGITVKDLENPDCFPLFQLRIADRISRGLIPVTQRQRDFEERLKEYLEHI